MSIAGRLTSHAFTWSLLLLAALVSGCASKPPLPTDDRDYRARAEHAVEDGIRVSVSVLSTAENEQVFGFPLWDKHVQPIWMEVENSGTEELLLMLLSIDRDYFTPSEVGWMTRTPGYPVIPEVAARFPRAHIPITIPPGAQRSGFVYTNHDPGVKALAVDLIGDRTNHRFEFVLPVPGFEADFDRVDLDGHYAADQLRDLDDDGLRAYLASLPCCVLGGDRKTDGDPLNLVVVGDGLDMLATFARQGWDMTETIRGDTVWQTIKSSVFGARYRTSPISPLYVFGRPQDVALQKARQTVDERNHLRLWLAPVTFKGEDVWVGQISRDIGVKLTRRTIVTHAIDPMVDEARLFVLLDLAASSYLGRIGFVEGVGKATREQPRFNYTDDDYYTDGLRAVLFLSDQPKTYQDIEWLDWAAMPSGLDME
jgi:hypothetical protein